MMSNIVNQIGVNYKIIPSIDLKVDKVCNCYGILISSIYTYTLVFNWQTTGSDGDFIYYDHNVNGFAVKHCSDRRKDTEYMILEYTKTTD